MEHVVAVRVTLESGVHRYVVTWGRIQHAVDGGPLAKLVLEHANDWDLGGVAVAAEVCMTMQEASGEPYFFDALVSFGQRSIPHGVDYESWSDERAALMSRGEELYYLGRSDR